MSLTCPNCHHTLEVKIDDRGEAPKVRRGRTDISPLTNRVLADIFEYMKISGPGEHYSTPFYRGYLSWTQLKKPPSQKAFAMGLQRNGAQRWRTASARGYDIPDLSDAQPAKMSHEQRERFLAAHQRQAVLDHRGSGGRSQPAAPVEKTWEDMSVQERIDAGMPPF